MLSTLSTLTTRTRTLALAALALVVASLLICAPAQAAQGSQAPGWHYFAAHINAYGSYGTCDGHSTAMSAMCSGTSEHDAQTAEPFDGAAAHFGWNNEGKVYIESGDGIHPSDGSWIDGQTRPGLGSNAIDITNGELVPLKAGGVHSGTDPKLLGQPGGPLRLYVGDASKPWATGYVLDVRGYVWY